VKHSNVIIIGAGVSGLYAASLLEKAGLSYQLIEARERTGGRILSSAVFAGHSADTHVDMGATWFWPDIQPGLAQLIKALGIPAIAQARPGEMLFERHHDTAPDRYPAYQTSPESYRLQGGMQALTTALVQQLPPQKILLGQQVTHVTRRGDVIQVQSTSAENDRQIATCDHLFLALPPALAAKITFSPALPERLIANWRNTATWMAPQAKYVALYRTHFLQEQGLSGDASSRIGPMVEIHDVSEPDSGITAIFGFIGVPAVTRRTVSETVLKNLCRAQLVRLFGPAAEKPEAEMIKGWAADPFTATEQDLLQENGYSVPESVEAHGNWAGKLSGIASEWSPVFSGYLAGAIDAASAGVRKLLTSA
jgi:monoamine oxidase